MAKLRDIHPEESALPDSDNAILGLRRLATIYRSLQVICKEFPNEPIQLSKDWVAQQILARSTESRLSYLVPIFLSHLNIPNPPRFHIGELVKCGEYGDPYVVVGTYFCHAEEESGWRVNVVYLKALQNYQREDSFRLEMFSESEEDLVRCRLTDLPYNPLGEDETLKLNKMLDELDLDYGELLPEQLP